MPNPYAGVLKSPRQNNHTGFGRGESERLYNNGSRQHYGAPLQDALTTALLRMVNRKRCSQWLPASPSQSPSRSKSVVQRTCIRRSRCPISICVHDRDVYEAFRVCDGMHGCRRSLLKNIYLVFGRHRRSPPCQNEIRCP